MWAYIISLVLILVGIFLLWMWRKGIIQSDFLEKLDQIAGILSLILGLLGLVGTPLIRFNSPTQTEELIAIENIIETEVNAAVELNLAVLESIFASDAIVVNRQGTPNDEDDDIIFEGWETIKTHHYMGFQIHFAPEEMTLVDLTIGINGDVATAVHKGVILNGEYLDDISVYTLEKRRGRWLITQLEFENK